MAIKRAVSLYSLQEDYYLGKLSLEDCIAKTANEIGATGIEYLPEQMPLPSYPYFSDADVDMWFGWMDKYKTVPTSWGTFLDYTLYKNRNLTIGECIETQAEDMKRAVQLGFKVFRTSILIKQDLDIFEALLPLAADIDLQIAVEIHAPRSIHSWWTQDFLEMILRTGTKHAGFVPDFGIFGTGLAAPYMNRMIREGANPNVIKAINDSYKAKSLLTADDVKNMNGGEKDLAALDFVSRTIYDDPEWLKEVLPFTQHIHGKFYEMTEDCTEESIDYEGPIKVLMETGWDGYIASEYEGQRHYFDIGCDVYMDPVEQCRRHHVMIKRITGEI